MPPLEVALVGVPSSTAQVLGSGSAARISRIDMEGEYPALVAPDGTVPDLILLDMAAGDAPVWKALEGCKGHERLRMVPTVVLGALNDAGLVRRAYELGANCCVRRPADPVLLRQRLQVILGYWLGVATLPTWRSRRDEPPKIPPAMVPPAAERARILMIDDLAEEGRLMREAMKHAGVPTELTLARSGAEGLERCRQSPLPHLILLDLRLGAERGHDVLAVLKAEPLTRTTPTLVLSSSRQESDIRTAYERGANGYLTKPSTFDGLAELMHRVAAFWLGTVVLPPCSVPSGTG